MKALARHPVAVPLSALVFAVAWSGPAGAGSAASAASHCTPPTAHVLASGLSGGSGSTVSPDGALYVAEPASGEISRVDPGTGTTTTFADGLPKRVIGVGGPMDVAFLGGTAYAIVTLVGPDVGGSDVVGLYRIDGPHSSTVVADIGAFAIANPPATEFEVPTGVQYAMEPYRGGFLVTDGHHNRVLQVRLDGSVSVFRSFTDIVPTGLARRGRTVYMAEAGPLPHLPQDGIVVSFRDGSRPASHLASGGRLLVDIERGPRHQLFALAQGIWPAGGPAGSPALPNTGQLLRVRSDGGFTVVARGLDRPTSLELIGKSAYVVTLPGEVWAIPRAGAKDCATG